MVTDGVFRNNGVFHVIPPPPAQLLTEQLRHAVLEFLCEEGRITETFKQRLLGWVHSGFSVHHDVKVKANDAAGQRQLARYMIRAPFSLEKTEYKADSGMIVYRSKMHMSLHRNYQIMPGARNCYYNTSPTRASTWCVIIAGTATVAVAYASNYENVVVFRKKTVRCWH